MKKLHIYTTIVITAVLLSIQGCGGPGGYGGGGGSSSGNVTSIVIAPAASTIAVNGTQQYIATAKDANGNTVNGVTYIWTSSNTSIATISSSGLATAMASGTSMITASVTYPAGGIYMVPTTITSNSATLTVSGQGMAMGTAAIGRAFVGALVSLKDSAGQMQVTTTDSQGRFQLPVSGLTPPFILKVADDQGHVMYSVGNSDGVINIDPLTDVIARLWYQAHGSSVEAAFADPRSQSMVDADSLKTLDSTLVKFMANTITVQGFDPATVSLLHTPFIADGMGLDGLLDQTTVRLSGARIVIGNTLMNGREIILGAADHAVTFHAMSMGSGMGTDTSMADVGITVRLAH